MGIRLFSEPTLERPVLIAGWPGIGNVGVVAVDCLRESLTLTELAEIEPWEFFYPRGGLVVRDGVLEEMNFPQTRFWFLKTEGTNLIICIGEEQPSRRNQIHRMADLVLDVAERFGCRTIYTAAAAVSSIHHTQRSRVWLASNTKDLIPGLGKYENAVLMSEVATGEGQITGLNGVLVGMAKKRGIPGICLLGEVPFYLQGSIALYPMASKAIVEVLTSLLGIRIDLTQLERSCQSVEEELATWYSSLPDIVREQLDQLRRPETISEDDKRRIVTELDEFFKQGAGGQSEPTTP